VFMRYGIAPDANTLRGELAGAIEDHLRLRAEAADLAAAWPEARPRAVALAVVVGREYV